MGKNVHAAQKGVAVCMLHVGQHWAGGSCLELFAKRQHVALVVRAASHGDHSCVGIDTYIEEDSLAPLSSIPF